MIVSDWVNFFLNVGRNTVACLGMMEISSGVSLAGIMVAVFLLGVILRAFLYKP